MPKPTLEQLRAELEAIKRRLRAIEDRLATIERVLREHSMLPPE